MGGSHDFAGFQAKKGRETTVRTMHRCRIEEACTGVMIVMEGNGFLRHMCRIVAGTLFEIGCGLREPSHLKVILETGNRADAGPTLPAEGLCLEHIEYEREWSEKVS